MNAQAKVKSAMTELILSQPFWAFLALKLTLKPDTDCETGWTDGYSLGYNPEWIESLTDKQVRGFIAHEVSHCAFGHCWRREARDAQKWNVAADHSVNLILLEAGFTLPPGALNDSQYNGKSAESIYSALPDPPKDDKGKDANDQGDGENDPGKCGEVRDCKPEAKDTDKEAEWQQAVIEAERMAQGSVPAGMQRAVTLAKQPNCKNLVQAVLEWTQRMSANDYSWRSPSRRFMATGLYLPTLKTPSVPRIAAAVDTSGSIDADNLNAFADALQRVLDECNPESLTVMACDSKIQASREFMPGDTITGPYPGGGGTRFEPVFESLATDPPCGCVYLTDLMGSFPQVEPDYPVLWVVRDLYAQRLPVPFGEVLYIG